MTPDATIRQAERDGGGLLARYRAGLLGAYPCAPDVACPCSRCYGSGQTDWESLTWGGEAEECPRCNGSGERRVPADPEDLLRLLAFLGVEEARALVPVDWGWGSLVGLKAWLMELSRLLAKLPARRVEVECHPCENHRYPALASLRPFSCCDGTGNVRQDVQAENWILVAACVAVGRECLTYAMDHSVGCSFADEWDALNAAEAWIADPTQERLTAWRRIQTGSPPSWVPEPPRAPQPGRMPANLAQPLHAASEVLGETRVRELVCAEIVRRVLG